MFLNLYELTYAVPNIDGLLGNGVKLFVNEGVAFLFFLQQFSLLDKMQVELLDVVLYNRQLI